MIIFTIFLVVLCFIAALYDFLFYKIPNAIILALLLVYIIKLIIQLTMGTPPDHFLLPFISFCTVLAVGFVLYVLKIFGAGDAKLLAVCSLWMAEINIIQFIMLTLIAGGGLAIIYIFWQQGLDFFRNIVLAKIVNINRGMTYPPTEKNAVPYGLAIFAGVIWVLSVSG